ncbi:MAG: glycosyltransferase family 4 protein [Kiloniellaceae bacterium]
MRIAFYAPLKPPDHPIPSGDRQMARLLIRALQLAGHEVDLASRLCSRDGTGDPARQARLERLATALAERLLRRYRAGPPEARPAAWLTYHLYYKAPDWIGPRVAAALAIPYLLAEASVAGKRAAGPWALGHRATVSALERAAAVVALNPTDTECLPDPARVELLKPFLDPAPFRAAAAGRERERATLAGARGLDPARPWLLAVAMMRPGDKLASYRLLAEALSGLPDLDWRLIIAGDGPARAEVEAAFAWAPAGRICFVGALEPGDLPGLYAACDILVWPAVGEAYGMALLEAQATGLPVLAGRSAGVAAIVRDGETGLLTAPGDRAAFAVAARGLLTAPEGRRRMAAAASAKVLAEHGLERAAGRLDAILRRAVGP